MRRLFASVREEFETDAESVERRALSVWTASDHKVRNWINRGVDASSRGGIRFSIDISPHTRRHSFAMHMPYHHVPPDSLQGHSKFESTAICSRIFALDVAAGQQVRFSFDTESSLKLLRSSAYTG